MTTEEQLPSPDIQQINGTEDDDGHEHDSTHEHDDETAPSTPSDNSSGPPVRRSRFFRSKRKQRVNEDQSPQVDSNADGPNEPIDSSGSSGKRNPKHPLKKLVCYV
jgi:hypothetical protein